MEQDKNYQSNVANNVTRPSKEFLLMMEIRTN